MTKILAFAASSSKNSINKKLVTYATQFLDNASIEIIDLNDFELPLFSVDKESELKEKGTANPALAIEFFNKIGEADALMISFAEHNGSYSAAYKNIFDWASRINPKVYQNKPMFLMATSPGRRGGASVLAKAIESAPIFTGHVLASYSLPSFFEQFDNDKNELIEPQKRQQLSELIKQFGIDIGNHKV